MNAEDRVLACLLAVVSIAALVGVYFIFSGVAWIVVRVAALMVGASL